MKQFSVKLIVAVCALITGLLAVAIWFNYSQFEVLIKDRTYPVNQSEFSSDTMIYSVKLCELLENSIVYNGRKVRLKVKYYQDIERLNLDDDDCKFQFRAVYTDWDNDKKIQDRLGTEAYLGRKKVELVGRFFTNIRDPDITTPQ